MNSFSQRRGLSPKEIPITVRAEAPAHLRKYILSLLDHRYQYGGTDTIRYILEQIGKSDKRALFHLQDPYKSQGMAEFLRECEWFQVYDAIEHMHDYVEAKDKEPLCEGDGPWDTGKALALEKEINLYFYRHGIGWAMDGGKIVSRGDEAHEQIVQKALDDTENAYAKAHQSLQVARNHLSCRPEPYISGAISQSSKALETVMRSITGLKKLTLGAIISQTDLFSGIETDLFSGALEKIAYGVWGFASNNGRHEEEEIETPPYEVAQLQVGLCSVLISFCIASKK
jgi:hypothetical protein